MESIRKADGAVKYFGYDGKGRCNYRLDENRNLIRTRYNMDAGPVDVAGSRGADPHAVLQGDMPGAEPELRSIYTYDEQGFLTGASEGGTLYQYTRDAEGRVLTKRAWGQTLYGNSYDGDGRLTGIVTEAGSTIYSYDRAGRLAKVSSDTGISAEYRYNSNGMQTEVLYGNGLKTVYRYDERSRLAGMESGPEGQPAFLQATYAYDGNGNRTARTEQFQHLNGTRTASVLTEYTYDSMNRLTGETRDGELTAYAYDLSGNRISRTVSGRTESYLYNSRNQLTELTGAGGNISYRYDRAGNLTEEKRLTDRGGEVKSLTYSYDVYNRNTAVTGTDFTQINHYDAEGYRHAVEENGKVTNFVYRGGMLVSELDGEKSLAKGYILGNEYIGATRPTGNSTGDSYYITDEQGSISYVLSKDGRIQNSYRYSAFGESIAAEETVPNRLRYNTQIADDLTGLYYLRARYYDPTTGRFTQEDVIYNDGLNLYAYCNSNPVMYCDPSGLTEKPCDGKVGGERSSESGSNTNYILFNRTHKDSLPKPKGTGPHGGRLQSHHGLQQQWAIENLSQYGYDPALAPTVTIETGIGVPHTTISNLQNARRDARIANGNGKWSSSLQDELSYIVSDFGEAGFSDSVIGDVLEQQYKMLDKLGVKYERIKY